MAKKEIEFKEIKDLLEEMLSKKDNNFLFELLDKEQQDTIKEES